MEESKDLENTTYSLDSKTNLNETNTDIENLNKKNKEINLSESLNSNIIFEQNNLSYEIEEKKEKLDNDKKKENEKKIEENKKIESTLYTTKYNNINPLEFYDLIIEFESLLKMEKGIKIYHKKDFKILKEINDLIIIGIIGESKKGKTYVLSRISKIDLPYGNSVITKGLSVKFPNLDKNKNFLLIDTAGNENALLKKEMDCRISTINTLEKYAIDKQSTEFFLQKYIIDTSNVIIAVVGILTNNDEKFINRIKNSCKKKTIFVIHNLKHFNSINNCKNHIKNIIKKSIFFDLTESYIFNIDKEYNNLYFIEVASNKNNLNIVVHLILAEENTEAGNYYNKSTFEYLRRVITSQTIKKRKFNLIEDIRESISNFSPQFYKFKINKDELILIDDKLKYDNKNNNVLNKWFVNEIGLCDFYSECYQPDYSYEIRENIKDKNIELELIIILEIPGKIEGNKDNSNKILQPKVIRRRFHYFFEFKGHFTIQNYSECDPIFECDRISYNKDKNNLTKYFLSIHFELFGFIIDNNIQDNFNSKNGIYTYKCYFNKAKEEEEEEYI